MHVTQPSPRSAHVVVEAAQPSTTPVSVETFSFRGTSSKVSATNAANQHLSAHSRLYAQAVDLREHKDLVFRQFGLHKSRNKAAHSDSSSPLSASKVTSMGTTRPPAYANINPTTLQRTTTSRNLVHSEGRLCVLQRKECIEHGCTHILGQIDYGKPSIGLSKTQSSFSVSVRLSKKPQIASRQSVHISKTQMPSARHRPSSAPIASTNTTQRKMDSSRVANTSKTRGNGSCGVNSSSGSSHVPQKHSNPSARTTATQSHHQISNKPPPKGRAGDCAPSKGKRPSMRIDVPPAALDSSAPALVQVSRCTSSPIIISSSVTEFGMRKRPSVASISSSLQQQPAVPHPRTSMLLRRDSKMDRLVEQLSVLKATLGLSDEDLQWKVESTKGNAFLAAERHLNDSEERYDRLVYEVQLLTQTPCEEVSATLVKHVRALLQQAQTIADSKPVLTACQNDVARLKKELLDARIAAELQRAKEDAALAGTNKVGGGNTASITDDAPDAIAVQEQLKVDMSTLNDMLVALGTETDRLVETCAAFTFLSPETAEVSNALLAVLKRILECAVVDRKKFVALCDQATETAQKLRGSKLWDLKKKESDLAKTMADIEVWKTRRDNAKEYHLERARRDAQWRRDHENDNLQALRLLRTLVPQDVQQLTIEMIIERAAKDGNVLFTYDLAMYIKQNRLLHWLVTHESDVARDNFLAIECVSWFLNFTSYDINELRAVAAVLPETGFEFDKDGKKTNWKTQSMDHVHTLVKQQNGETVKCGWDPVRKTRCDVPLQPLTSKQLVNAVYRYPSETEIQARIAKFELQKKRPDQKRDKFRNLENEAIPAAKAEYLAIADDARCDALQRSFGKATLIQMRDAAKHAFQMLCKTRDTLKSEIAHGETQWQAMAPTFEQYLAEVDKIRKLDPEVRNARIRGPFPSEIALKPRERAAFKKLSVEEEAQAWKLELDNAIASRGRELGGEVAAAAGDVVDSLFGLTAGEALGVTAFDKLADANAAITTPAEDGAPPQPRTSFRRVKSLQVSTEVLRFLQQDFCSSHRIKRQAAGGGSTAPRLERTASSATPTKAAGKVADTVAGITKIKRYASDHSMDLRNLDQTDSGKAAPSIPASSAAPAAAIIPVRPKSKALLQLLEKSEAQANSNEQASESKAPPLKSMNIFSELKNRFRKKTTESGDKDDETNSSTTNEPDDPGRPPPSPMKAMDFLDELKQKSQQKKKITAPSDSQQPDSHTAATSRPMEATQDTNSCLIASPPTAPVRMLSPMSFLDELRAKVKSTE
ncbi:hypothetical protein FI667_g10124, partial [Globisporangium splendens]